MRNWIQGLGALLAAFGLTACGGGGGGDGPSAALTLSPTTLTANQQQGETTTLTVRASVADPSVFSGAVYVYIVDTQQVLVPNVSLSQVDARTFAATLHVSPNLGVGRHRGTLQVQLCRDANCIGQYPGSPVPLAYDFNVSAAPLAATTTDTTAQTVHWGLDGAVRPRIDVRGSDLDWTATTTTPWLTISGGSGHGAGSFLVDFSSATTAVGSYTGKVTVRASDGQTADVAFSLEVLPTQFQLLSGVPSFSAVNGSTIAAQGLGFQLDNVVPSPWSATSSEPWLAISPSSGTTASVIMLQPDPRIGALASGVHSADVLLSSPGIPTRTVTTQLTLIPPTLSSPQFAVTLGGPKGRDLASAQSLPLSLNTDINAWPWSLSALPAWLSSTTTSGTVNHNGTPLSFAPRAANVSAGSVAATVNVNATVNGDAITLPLTVNLNADQRRLLPSQWGVGFASTPLATTLTRTLTVADNFGGSLGWTASSDSAWLGVTASGSTAGASTLTLTANPASLANATISTAKVTIASTSAGVAPAVVRVALWKDAAGPVAMTRLPQDYANLVADRIRPLVYANAGGTAIDVYNAYTAQKVGTIASAGTALGQMTVSPDGSRLYAVDGATQTLAVIDLDTRSRIGGWTLDNVVGWYTAVQAIRPNGVEVVLLGDGTAYTQGTQVAQGRSLGRTGIVAIGVASSLAASDDGRRVFMQDVGLSPASVAAFDVDYSAMSGGVLMVSSTASGWFINSSSNGRDIAVRGDGGALYTATGAPYLCSSLSPTTLGFVASLPGGNAYPNNVEVTQDGRVLCGIDDPSTAPGSADFWLHSRTGTLITKYKVAGGGRLLPGQLVATPDGFIVVALTDDPTLAFVPIGGP